jgi:hypothetical protein
MSEDTANELPVVEFKVNDSIWFLDKKGKCRCGVIKGLGDSPSSGPYASIFDEVDKRTIALTLSALSRKPIDAPAARPRKGKEKKKSRSRSAL